jgi:hypothetical protein
MEENIMPWKMEIIPVQPLEYDDAVEVEMLQTLKVSFPQWEVFLYRGEKVILKAN